MGAQEKLVQSSKNWWEESSFSKFITENFLHVSFTYNGDIVEVNSLWTELLNSNESSCKKANFKDFFPDEYTNSLPGKRFWEDLKGQKIGESQFSLEYNDTRCAVKGNFYYSEDKTLIHFIGKNHT